MSTLLRNLFITISLLALAACAGTEPKKNADQNANPLSGTQWQLTSIDYMDDTTITPDGTGQYTIAFNADGTVNMQADCNRLSGSYAYEQPSGLSFGPLMSTRAACPPESLYNRIVKDMPYVRSFVIKNGNLHIALMADGGIYNYSPMP